MSLDAQEPLLSDEETLALLAAVRDSAPLAPAAEGIDLASQDRRMLSAIAQVERIEPAFHAELKKLLRRITGAAPQLQRVTAELASLHELGASISAGAGIALAQTRGGSPALVVLAPALATTILERRLGAPIDAEGSAPRGALSAVDRAVLRPFIETALRAFCAAWCGDEEALVVRETFGAFEPQLITQSTERLLRTRVSVKLGRALESEILVALSAEAVRDTTPLERQTVVAVSSGDERLRIAARLTQAEVDLVAHLGVARSTVRAILSLAVGDLLRLDNMPDEPIELRVGGITKMRGVPVVDHGNLAVRVVETV